MVPQHTNYRATVANKWTEAVEDQGSMAEEAAQLEAYGLPRPRGAFPHHAHRHTGRGRRPPPLPRALAEHLAAADAGGFGRMDGHTLRSVLRGWGSTVRRRALGLRAHPTMWDRTGTYRSHLRRVRAATLEALPALWDFPASWALCLERRVPDAADRAHLCLLAVHIAEGRLQGRSPAGGECCPEERRRRCYRSVAHRMATLVGILGGLIVDQDRTLPCMPCRGSLPTLRALLPRTTTPADLTDLIGRMVAHVLRRRRQLDGRKRTTGGGGRRRPCSPPRPSTSTDSVLRCWLRFFRGAVANGVFDPTVPPSTRITTAAVRAAVERHRGPTEAGATATTMAPWWSSSTKPCITDADVSRLRQHCRTPRERVLLELLATTGLRREALGTLTVQDVWDVTPSQHGRGGARGHVRATEKFGRTHTVPMAPTLAEALAAWMRHPRCSPLLPLGPDQRRAWSSAAAPRLFPSASYVTATLAGLCRRAGLPTRFHPHQFRAYVVGRGLRSGRRLEDMARLLGHRTPAVTFDHYWTMERGNEEYTQNNRTVQPWIPMLAPPPKACEGRLWGETIHAIAVCVLTLLLHCDPLAHLSPHGADEGIAPSTHLLDAWARTDPSSCVGLHVSHSNGFMKVKGFWRHLQERRRGLEAMLNTSRDAPG